MTINDRVKIIIETLYNGNKRRFSSAIGVAPTVIENIVGTRQGKHLTMCYAKCAQMRIYLSNGS